MQQASTNMNDILFSAMSFLAMREHSVKELKDKLGRKFDSVALVDQVVAGLIEQNLQSDERFTQAFVAMRQRQAKGPVIIKIELREKGIAADLIARYVEESDPVWFVRARDLWRKKFHSVTPTDARERAKQMRFLQSRGFSSRHIQSIFTSVSSEDGWESE